MDNNEIQKMLRESALSGYELPNNKEALKNVLTNMNRPYRRWLPAKLWQIAGFFSGIFITAALFLVIEDNEQPGPTNNLGGIWCTYTDSAQGGSSKVWPPASNSCQNLFEKSSPGYGGKGYAVRIKGVSGNTDNPFLGVNTYLSQHAACPRCIGIDLRIYRGIRFKMRGVSGKGKLFFVLPHQSRTVSPDHKSCLTLTGYHDFQVDITHFLKENWTDVKLEFRKDFSQPAITPEYYKVSIETVLEDENLIQWHWLGEKNENIDLWIDNVELF